MVVRQFLCDKCGAFEFRQSIHDEPLTTCPFCEKEIKQIFRSVPEVIWLGRFKYMKGNPEVDMDKIEAEQNAQSLKDAKNKLNKALSEKTRRFY